MTRVPPGDDDDGWAGRRATPRGVPPMTTTMPSAPMPDPSTAIVDAACGAFDNERSPMVNVLQDARERRRAARLAISPRDIVNVTLATASITAAAQWLNVDTAMLMDRIQAMTRHEWDFVWQALLAAAG